MANGHRNNKKRAVAFAAVAVAAMMLITGLAFVNSADTSSAEPVTQDVTYYANNGTGDKVTVSYTGIVATEYNPTYWVGSFDNCPGKWTGPTGSHTYSGNSRTVTMVFAGWCTEADPHTDGAVIYAPGDVIPVTVTKLYANWAFPDLFSGYAATAAAKTGSDQTKPSYYAYTSQADLDLYDRMYTTQYYISGTLNFGTGNSYAKLSTGSYRSQSAYTGSGNIATFHLYNTVQAQGNVVIDNVTMTSAAASTNHGYATNVGLYANTHKLIIGTGIVNTFGSTANRAPQVYGGATGSTTAKVFEQKEIVSNDEDLNGMKFDMGSFVIIHSGSYYNVMAGGMGSMGNSTTQLSTYLVFKKATVIDSVGGGNATGSTGNPIYGSAAGLNQINPYQGGTFIYAIGLTTLGDSWGSQQTGYSQDITTNEGANFQGGCSVNDVYGSTHVFVSGNSSVWDVQGGGRAGYTKCAFTYVEISGNAEVRHAACGLVTDGNDSNNNITCAKGTKMVVADNPHISMLFGAGYDTWANTVYTNMKEGKSIEVDIRGGTIGFVYGGGYRGTVGSQGNDLTVKVNISGGDILFDVFGGGRGGIDKMLRTASGKDPSGSGYKNSTGQSVIYGDVSVTVTGTAHVYGNVYAGGESVPMLTSYYGTEFTSNDKTVNVAEVIGKTSVTVSGNAVIEGSVFGSGKGIGIDGGNIVGTYTPVSKNVVDKVDDYYTKNLVVSKNDGDKGWKFLEWYNHSGESGGIYYDTSSASMTKYLEYAKTEKDASVTVDLTTTVVDENTVGIVKGSVYGGGAYSRVDQNSSVSIDKGTVSGDVFGGGLGRLEIESVHGNSSVEIGDGTIDGNVYGGSAYGITHGDASVAMSGGTVFGSVYGGGLGDYDKVSVEGNSRVSISDGKVYGDVFGGSAFGITVSEARVTINGGTVGGNVFAGGLGKARSISVKGKRYLLMTAGTVEGSVYGGSSLGDDASSKSAIQNPSHEITSDAYVTITSGHVTGSVYGGGYKGATTGMTYLYIGYSDFSGTESDGRTIYVGNSIYGGGDVGELLPGQPMFRDTMVYGGSKVFVNGQNNYTFSGTVSAAGNSCLTDGETEVYIKNLNLNNQIESVHRAGKVTIEASKLKFSGKINGTGDNTKYSFYGIDHLNLKNGATVYLYAQMGAIGEFSSLNSAGSPTKSSAPLNRLNICNGTMFEVKKETKEGTVYGNVNGYTILSILTVEDYYGAVTLGSKDSPGGFVIEHNGSYTIADKTDFANCRCWFISGSLQITTSSTLGSSSGEPVNDGGHYISIPSMSTVTDFRYTGGYFYSTAGYTLTDLAELDKNSFAVLLGTDSEGRGALKLDGGNGMFLPNAFDSTIKEKMTNKTSQPLLQIRVYGYNDYNVNRYLGYATIYLQEVVKVTYKSGDETVTDYIVQNRIEIHVDMYTEGANLDESVSATIQTVNHSGYVDVMLPSKLSDYEVYLKSVDIRPDESVQSLDVPLYVSTVKNNGGTTGWNYPLKTIDVTGGYSGPELMQTLTGAYVATIRISVTDFTPVNPEDSRKATIVLYVVDPDDANNNAYFTINLKLMEHPQVYVNFYDEVMGVNHLNVPVPYGSTINQSDCPNTLDNFVGWYTDEDFINEFNFNVPLVSNINLYACYMYTVTFDYQNGMSSKMYVKIASGGIAIHKPADPVWQGYTFTNWFKDQRGETPWLFIEDVGSPDLVTGDITLYAIWSGDEYFVRFIYNLGSGEQTLTYMYEDDQGETVTKDGFRVRYGNVYGRDIDCATKSMLTIAEQHSIKFVRWQLKDESGTLSVGIYKDTTVSPYSIYYDDTLGMYAYNLYAEFTNEAINVKLSTGVNDLSAEIASPVDYLIYPNGSGVYHLECNNATRTGYRITGWSFTGGQIIPIGTDIEFTRDGNDIVYTDGTRISNCIVNDVINLTAVWAQNEYTITIVQPAGGSIVAVYGNVEYDSEITAKNGEDIILRYTSDGSYRFDRWTIRGEGDIWYKDDEQGNRTWHLTVVGSCAVYAQLKALETVSVKVYINGGEQGLLAGLPLYLRGEKGDTPIPFDSAVEYETGKYYGLYSVSSTIGHFDIAIWSSIDRTFYKVGNVTVSDSAVEASARVVTVVSDMIVHDEGGDDRGDLLVGFPRYVNLDDVEACTFTFSMPAGYLLDGRITVTEGTVSTELGGGVWTYTILADPPAAVVLSGTMEPIYWTVALNSPSDLFVFKINGEPVESLRVRYGAAIGILPVLYEKDTGIQVGTDLSKYKDGKWYQYYDENDGTFANPISTAFLVEGNITIFADATDKDKVNYSVLIFLMDTNGEYPTTPYKSVDLKGWLGQVTSYVPPTITGFTINNGKSDKYTDYTVDEELIEHSINLRYDRASYSNPKIYIGAGSVDEGWLSDHGWEFVEGEPGDPNYITKSVVYYEEAIPLPTVVLRGHDHNGWNVVDATYDAEKNTATANILNNDGSLKEPKISAVLVIKVYELTLTTIYGKFTNDEDTIVLNVNYGVVVGTAVQSPSEPEHRHFRWWLKDGEQFDLTTTMEGNLQLSAYWETDKYRLEFAGDEGIGISATVNSVLIDSGSDVEWNTKVIFTIRTKEVWYAMMEGYPQQSGSEPGTLVEKVVRHEYEYSLILTEATSVTVKSRESTFTVQYYVDYESDDKPYKIVQLREGSSVDMSFHKVGYNFDGWYDKLSDDRVIVKRIDYISENVTLFGWTSPIHYTVVFDSNGGTGGTTESVDMVYDAFGKLTDCGFTKGDSEFIGWSTSNNAGVMYIDGETVENVYDEEKAYTVDEKVYMNLYAVWFDFDEYSGVYDAKSHASTASGTGVTVYYSEKELDKDNYSTEGSTTPVSKTHVGPNEESYKVYYYRVDARTQAAGHIWITITKKALSVEAVDKSVEYGSQKPQYTADYIGFVPGEGVNDLGGLLTPSCPYEQFSSVGEYTITLSGLESGDYDISYKTGTLSVYQKTVGLQWSNISLVYNGYAQKPVATATGLVNGDPCSVGVDVKAGEGLDVGTYTATAVSLTNGNYRLPVVVTQQFSITQKSLRIVGISVPHKIYDASPGATIAGEALLDGVTEPDEGLVALSFTGASARFSDKNVGADKKVTISGYEITGVKEPNYKWSDELTFTASILPMEIVMVSGGGEWQYDGNEHTNGDIQVKSGEFYGAGYTVKFTEGRSSQTVVGKSDNEFTCTIDDASLRGNYRIVTNYGTLKVTAANITIVDEVKGYSGLYDGESHNIVKSYSVSTVDGSEVTLKVSADGINWVDEIELKDCVSGEYRYLFTAENHSDLTGFFNVEIQKVYVIKPTVQPTYGYTGQPIKPEIPDSDDYTAINDGGTDVGDYSVILTLTDPTNHYWYGEEQTLVQITLNYSIQKAPSSAVVVKIDNLVYNRSPQTLVTLESTEGGTVMEYSIDGISYSTELPKATKADVYTVYWKLTGDDNHSDSTGWLDVSINPASPATVITVQPAVNLVYNQGAQPLLIVTIADPDVALQYSLDGGQFTTTIPSATDSDNYTVTYRYVPIVGDNYSSLSVDVPVTIEKADYDPHAIFEDDKVVYDGLEHILTVGFEPGYGVLPEGIELVAPDEPKVNAGVYEMVATFTVSGNYNPIAPMKATLTIEKADIVYNAVAYANKTYDGQVHPVLDVSVTTVGATVAYSLDGVQYGSGCPTVCDVDQFYVWMKITLANHNDVVNKYTVSVIKRQIFVSSASDSKVYDGTALTAPELIVKGTLAEGHTIPTTATGTITNYTEGGVENSFADVEVRDAQNNNVTANYDIRIEGTGILTIIKATYDTSHMHFEDMLKPYREGTSYTLEIVMDEGYVLPDQITPQYTENTFSEIGDHPVTVTFIVSDNYNGIPSDTKTLSIIDPVIDFDVVAYAKVYDGQSHPALVVTINTPGATVTYSLDGVVYDTQCPNVTEAGSTLVWFKLELADHDTQIHTLTATVSKRAITVSSATVAWEYDGYAHTAPELTYTGELVAGHTLSGAATGSVTNVAEGNVANVFTVSIIDAYENDVSANYTLDDDHKIVGKLSISPATFQHIHFDDAEYAYDGTEKSIVIWIDEGYVLPDQIVPAYEGNTRTEVGEYDAIVSFQVSSNYVQINPIHATLTIKESRIFYTVKAYSDKYDGLSHDALTVTVTTQGATVSYSYTQDGEYLPECPKVTTAGTLEVWYLIELTGHTTVNGSAVASVEKRDISVASRNDSKEYDGQPLTSHELYLFSGSLVAGHHITTQATGTVTNAGSTPNGFVTPVIVDSDDNIVTSNYNIKETRYGTLTVSPATLTVTVLGHAPFEYDGTYKTLTAETTGLKGTDKASISLEYMDSLQITTYQPVKADTYTVNEVLVSMVSGIPTNYKVVLPASLPTLTITPRLIDAPASDDTVFIYDGNSRTYYIQPNTALYTISKNSYKDAGSYVVTVTLKDGVNNRWRDTGTAVKTYDFVIQKRDILVVADPVSKSYGDEDPEFTVTYSGAVEWESPESTGSLVPATRNLGANDLLIGTFALRDNGLFLASNYNFSFVGDGRFTINPLMVDVPAAVGVLYYDGSVQVAYADGQYYTVTGGSAKDVGTYTATLKLNDTDNYVWSDSLNSIDRELQYRIALAVIDLAYTAYSGEYDAQYHDAVTVTDADGATVYYGFEMMGWTTDVPKIRNVSDSGVLYIKAEKLNHETLYVEVPFGITKAKLDVYAEDTMIILSDDIPEFTFRAEGFKGNDTIDSLTCDISFGTPYRKGTDPYGTYAITLNGQPVDVNYEIVGHDGILTVAKHRVTVVWLHTEYIYTRTVQEVKVALLDEEGNLTPCGAVVTDKDGNAVEFRDVGDYIATAILEDGYVLDPAQASSLTANVSIVSNEAYELNWEVVAVVVIIVLISAELIYTMFVRRK